MAKSLKDRWLDAVQSDDGPRQILRHLLLCLGRRINRGQDSCWPGMRRIASEMGVQLGTVSALVSEAEAAGWLEVERRSKGRRGGTYFVYHPRIPTLNRREAESVQDGRTVETREAFRDTERLDGGRSVQSHERSVQSHGLKPFSAAERSSSVVSQEVSHGSVPSVLTNEDGVPQGWQPPSDWQDHRVFFDTMHEDARRMAHYLLDGDARFAITAPSDLDLLGPEKLIRLQHWVATTRKEAA